MNLQISTETALRETMIESEQRRNRVMVLAQQLADATAKLTAAERELAELKAVRVQPTD